jgi:2-oxoglutarate dehydrogenase E2 component (dihydrolipoamide succinyltransferase)
LIFVICYLTSLRLSGLKKYEVLMKYDMVMPKMGESITEGTIIKWLKQIGDTVEKDEIVLEISTDKVDSEIPTPVSGKIVEFLANENDTVEVGKVIARIDTEGEAESTQPQAEAPPAKEVEEPVPAEEPAKTEAAPVQKPAATDKEEKPESTKFFSPVVLNIAHTEGVSAEEIESIEGSGISGRVTKKDILNFIETRKSGTTAPAAAAPLTRFVH